jgi:DNA-binding response OmpR family regulator
MAYHILWVDDEIDLLQPHVLFLQQKGFKVTTVFNGNDAIDFCKNNSIDILLLDENMPGLSGLETLEKVKKIKPNLPIVMITKSDEEQISEQAIGSQISDYLLKPFNPNQVLISLKKILETKRLVLEKTRKQYQEEFNNIKNEILDAQYIKDWEEIYKKLVFWELQLECTDEVNLKEILSLQKEEANYHFSTFIMENYENWFQHSSADKPILSHQILKKKVFPEFLNQKTSFLIVIDNLRYDQWKCISTHINQYFKIEEEILYCSILPTTTGYARNALFSGLMPGEIAKFYPDLWVHDDENEAQNQYENILLEQNLKRNKLDIKFSFHKIITQVQGKHLIEQLPNLVKNQLIVCVFNYIDLLSHARTDKTMIRELAFDDSAYRSLTKSWFEHSVLFELLKYISHKKLNVYLTTDHGTIFVKKPQKIIGDKETTNDNLRYKKGKSIATDGKRIYFVKKPENICLPKRNITTCYAFCTSDLFFVYPNNYNHYVNYYKNTLQHGGISMEEMLIPFAKLTYD